MYLEHNEVQKREIYYWPPRHQGLHDKKQTAVIAQRRKRSQLDGSLLEQRLHHLSQGFVPDGVEAKSRHDPALRPDKKGKNDEPARGTSRGELYLLVPPCDLFLTAALDKVAKEDVEDSKESSLILTIAVDNRE